MDIMGEKAAAEPMSARTVARAQHGAQEVLHDLGFFRIDEFFASFREPFGSDIVAPSQLFAHGIENALDDFSGTRLRLIIPQQLLLEVLQHESAGPAWRGRRVGQGT